MLESGVHLLIPCGEVSMDFNNAFGSLRAKNGDDIKAL
jgi:hypothetical protein